MGGNTDSDGVTLSRRERQIMDIVYRDREATARDVLAALPDPPSYSAVRGLLRVLVDKGHLRHRRRDGVKYVYSATVPKDQARRSALRRMLATFFEGSAEQAVAALLDLSQDELSDADLERLAKRIDEVREEGR